MRTLEALTIVRQRLESGWTQGAEARDIRGEPVVPYSSDAVSFCIYGAIGSLPPDIYDEADTLEVMDLIQDTINDIYDPDNYYPIDEFNDTNGRTKEEVLDLIDRTIASLGC